VVRALRIHPAYIAAVCALAVVGLYLAVISQQEDGGGSRVAFVAVSIAVAGVAAAAAESSAALAAGLVAAWAVGTLWIWAFLGVFSIGILIVPAGIFATIALTRRQANALVIAPGIALAFLTAVAGLALT
jgi:hypothetical protein